VRARNSSGVGSISTPASGYIPLAAPTGVAASTTLPHHVAVTWNSLAGATSYQIFRSTTNDFSTATRIAAGITATFFDDTTAVLGQNYFYWVRAKNAVAVGLQSNSVMGSLG
jgi:fibronectin type 3 domain-containing protein